MAVATVVMVVYCLLVFILLFVGCWLLWLLWLFIVCWLLWLFTVVMVVYLLLLFVVGHNNSYNINGRNGCFEYNNQQL